MAGIIYFLKKQRTRKMREGRGEREGRRKKEREGKGEREGRGGEGREKGRQGSQT